MTKDVDITKLESCISRLWHGVEVATDFKDFVEALRVFSSKADAQGLVGMGEEGSRARGVALAYREILEMIETSIEPQILFEQKPADM